MSSILQTLNLNLQVLGHMSKVADGYASLTNALFHTTVDFNYNKAWVIDPTVDSVNSMLSIQDVSLTGLTPTTWQLDLIWDELGKSYFTITKMWFFGLVNLSQSPVIIEHNVVYAIAPWWNPLAVPNSHIYVAPGGMFLWLRPVRANCVNTGIKVTATVAGGPYPVKRICAGCYDS